MKICEIETPALLVDKKVLERNIFRAAAMCREANIKLRPHVKAHKCPSIARLQIKAGACGICVAKISEAEVMRKAGIKDILIIYNIVGERKIERLIRLAKKTNLKCAIDNISVAKTIGRAALREKIRIPILLEIDTGLGRCGVQPGRPALEVAQRIHRIRGINFKGILTHEGHLSVIKNNENITEGTKQCAQAMLETATLLKKNGIFIEEISVGSTPAFRSMLSFHGITECHPGTYIFNDCFQVIIGSATWQDCSLTVISTVVSTPTPYRAIIDAGSKCLTNDHYNCTIGNGKVLINGHKVSDIIIKRLYEEHGVLEIRGKTKLRIGQKIRIIPNHSCNVVNLHDSLYCIVDETVDDIWRISARGMLK